MLAVGDDELCRAMRELAGTLDHLLREVRADRALDHGRCLAHGGAGAAPDVEETVACTQLQQRERLPLRTCVEPRPTVPLVPAGPAVEAPARNVLPMH